jgi:flagellin-like hook-associated protein FlgL
MAEINFDITPPISANKIIKDNQPQKIEKKYVSQSERADSLYENFSSHTITERIKVEVSGLETSTRQVNDSISMLETIEGLSNKISFALNQKR